MIKNIFKIGKLNEFLPFSSKYVVNEYIAIRQKSLSQSSIDAAAKKYNISEEELQNYQNISIFNSSIYRNLLSSEQFSDLKVWNESQLRNSALGAKASSLENAKAIIKHEYPEILELGFQERINAVEELKALCEGKDTLTSLQNKLQNEKLDNTTISTLSNIASAITPSFQNEIKATLESLNQMKATGNKGITLLSDPFSEIFIKEEKEQKAN